MSEKNEWKPIASAPKDGTGILGYWDVGGIHDCNFRAVKFHRGAWWETNEDYKVREPTHWMPLPAAPGSIPSAPGDAQDERQAFEAWAKRKKMPLARIGQQYDDFWVDHAWNGWQARAALAVPAAGDAQPKFDIEAAAQKLAECMDYPWAHMPEQGRTHMRKYAQAVIDAALAAQVPQQGEA